MNTASFIVTAAIPVISTPLATARAAAKPAPDDTAFITDWYLTDNRDQAKPNSETKAAPSSQP